MAQLLGEACLPASGFLQPRTPFSSDLHLPAISSPPTAGQTLLLRLLQTQPIEACRVPVSELHTQPSQDGRRMQEKETTSRPAQKPPGSPGASRIKPAPLSLVFQALEQIIRGCRVHEDQIPKGE